DQRSDTGIAGRCGRCYRDRHDHEAGYGTPNGAIATGRLHWFGYLLFYHERTAHGLWQPEVCPGYTAGQHGTGRLPGREEWRRFLQIHTGQQRAGGCRTLPQQELENLISDELNIII